MEAHFSRSRLRLTPFSLRPEPGQPHPRIARWAASLPPGTSGTAANLLAEHAAPADRLGLAPPWTPTDIGVALRAMAPTGAARRRAHGSKAWVITPGKVALPALPWA